MAEPDIEIRWGNGFEQKEDRDQMRPLLRAATEVAFEGMVELGLPVDRSHRMVVHQGNHPQARTAATAPGTFHMAVWQRYYRWGTDAIVKHIAATMVHEQTHCRRLEWYVPNSLFELAATEGLAYNLERKFRYWAEPNSRAKGMVNRIAELDGRTINPMRRLFMRSFAAVEVWDTDSCDEWFNTDYFEKLSKTEIIGIRAVKERVDRGEDIATLLMLPPGKVLEAPVA